jgi:hypothetical protein
MLQQLPFFEIQTTAASPDGPVLVRPYQIMVWVSISEKGIGTLDPKAPRFPAVLDTGNNHNFALRQGQLERWAGLPLAGLFGLGRVFVGQQSLPLVGANVWVHRNKRGTRDLFSRQPPCRLELHEGIVVYPHGVWTPARLPLLGLRALVRNGLNLTLHSQQCQISLRG